jgi:hypothetical protein
VQSENHGVIHVHINQMACVKPAALQIAKPIRRFEQILSDLGFILRMILIDST